MDTTQAEIDLAIAHEALRNIETILRAISTDPAEADKVFYEVGRAMGTAKSGLNMSGAERKAR
jgi:hypothetical protein